MVAHRTPAYDTTARRLHWWSAVAVGVAAPLGLCQATVPDEGLADLLLRAHLVAALAVLVLTVSRIAHTVRTGRPDLPSSLAGASRTLARVLHGVLPVVLAGIVVAGLVVWLAGDLPLAPWAATVADVDRSSGAAIAHRVLAYLFAGLVLVHVVGVLVHDAIHPGGVDRMRSPRHRPVAPGLASSASCAEPSPSSS